MPPLAVELGMCALAPLTSFQEPLSRVQICPLYGILTATSMVKPSPPRSGVPHDQEIRGMPAPSGPKNGYTKDLSRPVASCFKGLMAGLTGLWWTPFCGQREARKRVRCWNSWTQKFPAPTKYRKIETVPVCPSLSASSSSVAVHIH